MPQNETLLFVCFNAFVLLMLALDLGVFHKKVHVVTVREAAWWSVVWITLSLLFGAGLFHFMGKQAGLEFLAGYLLEKSLSVDNIFVFILIFSYFGVPPQLQHRVLFWGVLGALIMRALFIALGVVLITRFDWILYIFGFILVVSGWKMMRSGEVEVHPERNFILRMAKKMFPVEVGYDSPRFILRKGGKIHITTLFLVLIAVETTDVIFATDSIPAVFGVTHDPFIVYSSNVFAILGLRALYFVLAGVMTTFFYLKPGLSIVLIFIGMKMLAADLVHVSIGISLGVIGVILTVSVIASIIRNKKQISLRNNHRSPTSPEPLP
ncbi:MAG TPA: TerC family protein [Bacteroidota bacterium]